MKAPSKLFEDVWSPGGKNQVWMSHGDRITKMPPGFSVAGTSPNAPFAIIQDETRKYYGLMFHPEVVHTPDGAKLIRNFVRKIAGLSGDWTMRAFREEEIAEDPRAGRQGQGDLRPLRRRRFSRRRRVLIHEAIGDQLTCVFVDHGMLRLDEAKTVVDLFRHHYNIPLVHVDASKQVLGRSSKASPIPETKRKTIGRLFIEVFEAGGQEDRRRRFPGARHALSRRDRERLLHRRPSVTIKSHHNVGGLPERMNMKLVEPLRELFKDEVRKLGRELGLPEIFVGRHPFPGPGLAIRCPGDITQDKLDILRKADAVYIDQIRKHGLYDDIWQAFAVLLPVKTVGVMGDGRTYDFVVGLRAVTSTDGMTADFYQFDMKFLGETATRIINEVKGVNRVVYDVTSKPPGTIEWE